ncbi:MAG: hypothetical protein HZY75_07745 [Nocardioidaceae bacterium]|nr:MAG: hypothetical protein HZY75_07745 [Nocardioidaceae bacterium]
MYQHTYDQTYEQYLDPSTASEFFWGPAHHREPVTGLAGATLGRDRGDERTPTDERPDDN